MQEVLKDEESDSKLIRSFKAFVRVRSEQTAHTLVDNYVRVFDSFSLLRFMFYVFFFSFLQNSVPANERGMVFAAFTSTRDILASCSSSGVSKNIFDRCKPFDDGTLQEETLRELVLGENVGVYILVRILFEKMLDGKGKVKNGFFHSPPHLWEGGVSRKRCREFCVLVRNER